MITLVTNDIRVTVETKFQDLYSDPAKMYFLFTYKIKIENTGDYDVQLLRRHWNIVDSISEHRDVDGAGVVSGSDAGGVGDGSDEKVEKKVKKPSATPVSDFEAKEKKKGVVRGCLSAACVPRPASVWRRLLSDCTV